MDKQLVNVGLNTVFEFRWLAAEDGSAGVLVALVEGASMGTGPCQALYEAAASRHDDGLHVRVEVFLPPNHEERDAAAECNDGNAVTHTLEIPVDLDQVATPVERVFDVQRGDFRDVVAS